MCNVRKIGLVATIIMLAGVLCGCGLKYNLNINEDLSGSETVSYYFTEEEVVEIAKENNVSLDELKSDMVYTEENGKGYYVMSETVDVASSDVESIFYSINKDHAVFIDDLNSEDSAGAVTYDMRSEGSNDLTELYESLEFTISSYTFPYKIVKTNAPLSEDGRTITADSKTWNEDEKRVYVIFNDEAANSKKVTYSGVANNKIYKTKKYITINSPNVIKQVSVYRNGKEYKDNTVYIINNNNYDGVYNKFAFVKDGKYTIKTTLMNGYTATLKFTVDKTKPTTNMKTVTYKYKKAGRKITFKDATSGVKKATLNGKTIKSGKKVKSKGKYKLVITDKAGNVKKVNFKIK